MRQGVTRAETPRERRARDAREELRAVYSGAELERRWLELAKRWDFGDVNDLIERHNRHYPAESRLPMNPRTGDFVLVNGRPYAREPLDADWILARFPSDG